ncbi:MAG: hypothetical protein ACRERU_02215 [Methylococcales bacterium]
MDHEVLRRGVRLYHGNNLKRARFKEIFPAAAKSDAIDARKIREWFPVESHWPLAKDVLQAVLPVPEANRRWKRLSRRRRQLVNEKMIVQNRLQSDLQAVCPSLVDLTGSVNNLWFLRFLTCRESLPKRLRLHPKSLFGIPGVGRNDAGQIRDWQCQARFSDEVD